LNGLVGVIGIKSPAYQTSSRTSQWNLRQPDPRVEIAQGATITSLATPMRQIQFGLKVIF
jgi:hypothetical protein